MPSDEDSETSPAASGTPKEAFQRVKRSPELPAPEAVRLRMTPIAATGTLLWTIALILTQLFQSELADSGRAWWGACALAGVALGIFGTAVMAVFDRRHFRSSDEEPEATDGSDAGDAQHA
ncbi:DUF2530 domain-containing protein [Glycomyces buryatensis]|uniref:DUF2530 domain-containing protein n=1 Tax=Glycomyces buryatensis TaxID=2570927 RepID=UPI001FE50DD1|nr:DUF2530 domain-containing protein [Glycomyces buryatensis]